MASYRQNLEHPMQLPPASSASQAASILAQSTSKNSTTSSGSTVAAGQTSLPHVEKSEGADKDRDAQGQGDGFSSRPKARSESDDILDFDQSEESQHHAAQLPDEPPSQFDIVA